MAGRFMVRRRRLFPDVRRVIVKRTIAHSEDFVNTMQLNVKYEGNPDADRLLDPKASP